jgi:nanoRNase/pAp phosphatase (c-di-AMP/oligoRNAs hydrolase)
LVQEAFTLHWEERTWLAINANIPGSQVFAKVFDPQRHDSMLSFAYSPQAKAWKVHLRAYDEVAFPVDKIAVQYGGGGHRGAAGFACKQLPFVL